MAADPQRYRGIGVVFSSGEAGKEDVQQAAHKAVEFESARREPKLKDGEIDRLPNWSAGDLFTGWSDADASAWPKLFSAQAGTRGHFSTGATSASSR